MTDTESRRPRNEVVSISAWDKIEQPLDSVVGLAEMLSDRSRDMSAAARGEMIEQLTIRAQAVQQAVRNVVLASQLSKGELEFGTESVELRELVEAVTQEWSLAAHGARITLFGSVDAIGDAGSVARAVRNLIEDAVDRGARRIDIRIGELHSTVLVEIDDVRWSTSRSSTSGRATRRHRMWWVSRPSPGSPMPPLRLGSIWPVRPVSGWTSSSWRSRQGSLVSMLGRADRSSL